MFKYSILNIPFDKCYLQTRELPRVVEIRDGHFCKCRIAKDAATFDLMNNKLKTSFHALVDVTLVRILEPKQSEAGKTAKQTEDCCDMGQNDTIGKIELIHLFRLVYRQYQLLE